MTPSYSVLLIAVCCKRPKYMEFVFSMKRLRHVEKPSKLTLFDLGKTIVAHKDTLFSCEAVLMASRSKPWPTEPNHIDRENHVSS